MWELTADNAPDYLRENGWLAPGPARAEVLAGGVSNLELRVDPFYQRVRERCPDVAACVDPLIDDLLAAREALCHGDYSPKNLLVHAAGLTLVDYETGHLGEPAMDLGFFFSHLLLKALHA